LFQEIGRRINVVVEKAKVARMGHARMWEWIQRWATRPGSGWYHKATLDLP
jgi:hypothetical protein